MFHAKNFHTQNHHWFLSSSSSLILVDFFMELFFPFLLVAFVSLIFISLHILFYKRKFLSRLDLPPGRVGWPIIIGESLEFLSTGWRGYPEKFVFDRMVKYSAECFKTSILGYLTVFLCGPSGNKLLFTNENKLVTVWWPEPVNKIFPTSLQTDSNEESKKMRPLLPQFLKPEALQRYIGIMDAVFHKQFCSWWEGKDEIYVFPLAKKHTFFLACRLFLSVEEPDHIARFADPFHLLAAGIVSIPLDFPGTPFNKAVKAAKVIRKELMVIIKQRKHDLAMKKATPVQDILSHMLKV